MKNKIIILILLMATGVSAQMWGQPVNWNAPWINVRTINATPGEFTVEVKGGVTARELDSLGFATIGSGTFYNGYQSFTGGADWDSAGGFYQTYMMYPPTTIDEQMVWPTDRRMFFKQYTYYCGCADTPQSDTVYTVDAFGYWRCLGWDPENNFDFKGYYLGQLKAHKCMAQPCPIGGPGPMIPKNYICFTDSMYVPLPDDAIPCGQSRIYILANVYGCDSVYAVLSIPEHDPERVRLERISQYSDIFTGSYINSVSLGLKSFNQVTLEADAYPPPAANELVTADKMNVVLPIITSPPNDTLVIDHDLMKLAEDIVVDVKIKNDNTAGLINPTATILSAGYRLKTKWVANENLESLDSIYTRIYPADSSYKYSNATIEPFDVTFFKDSVYAIGGALTIEATGNVFYAGNLDPHYEVNSDSITEIWAAVPRYHIVIDEDPSNAELIAELGSDVMRAIAWYEGACSQTYTGHNVAYPKYNNYWSDATRCPCENGSSTATGIMQMLRSKWQYQFLGDSDATPYDIINGQPFFCSWDSVAWNWKVNIHKGNYIYFQYLTGHLKSEQLAFPESCSYSNCGDTPLKKNKIDLKFYGYHHGRTAMGKILDDIDWAESVEEDDYTNIVRTNYYKKEWQ